MKKELDALRVKTELMLDFDEEEDEEFENFSALHCNNCGAELLHPAQNSVRNAVIKCRQLPLHQSQTGEHLQILQIRLLYSSI